MTNQPTDKQTKRDVESRSTRLKNGLWCDMTDRPTQQILESRGRDCKSLSVISEVLDWLLNEYMKDLLKRKTKRLMEQQADRPADQQMDRLF